MEKENCLGGEKKIWFPLKRIGSIDQISQHHEFPLTRKKKAKHRRKNLFNNWLRFTYAFPFQLVSFFLLRNHLTCNSFWSFFFFSSFITEICTILFCRNCSWFDTYVTVYHHYSFVFDTSKCIENRI